MLRVLKNEKGMALVIVLLIITVFTVLGLTVMAATINNAKQVTMSQDDIQTTDIAEMGVKHYQAQLTDFFNSQLNSQIEAYKNLVTQDFNSSTDKTITSALKNMQAYEDQIASNLISTYKSSNLYTAASNQFISYPYVDQATNRYYKINTDTTPSSIATSDQKETIKIVFHSYGYNQNLLEKRITATFTFTFYINQGSLQTLPVTVNQFNFGKIVPLPTVNGTCPSSVLDKQSDAVFDGLKCTFTSNLPISQASFSQSTIIFPNGLNIDKINQGINNGSILYVTGIPGTPIILNDSHVNGIDNSQIYMNGTVKFGSINQGITTGSKIVVDGTAIFGIDSNDKFKGFSNSSIYVNGTADFTNIDITKFDTSTAKICVNGNVIGGSNVSGYPVYYSTQPDLTNYNKYCSTGTTNQNTLNFSSNFFTIDPASLINITYDN